MSDAEGRFRDLDAAARPMFKLLIRPEPHTDATAAIRGLRWVLKTMLRGYGLRCLSVTEVTQETERR